MIRNCFYRILVISILSIISGVIETFGQSPYIIEVVIPEYDSLNKDHFLIEKQSDWERINDSELRFFYVRPNADYGTIVIHADGTEEKRRYISLHNGNNIHPAKLDVEEQSNVNLIFDSAHYWIVDRMSSISSKENTCYVVRRHSSNILLNRLYLSEFYDGISIRGSALPPYSENITVQNSRFDQMSSNGLLNDRIAILITGDIWDENRTIIGTKILSNEIKNCNDGIALPRHPYEGNDIINYAGTIIDNNHIYVDNSSYTDGDGNPTPSGLWSITENAIDLKGGSEDPSNPVVVSNNFIWGFRETDPSLAGSGSPGAAITGHYHVKNAIFRDNIIFNSNRGLMFSNAANLPYSGENIEVTGNIFYDIGFDPYGEKEYANFFYSSKNVQFQKNTIVGRNKKSIWFSINGTEQDIHVTCNAVIDSRPMQLNRSSSTAVANNTFYDTDYHRIEDGKYYMYTQDAAMQDLIFTTDNFTKNPREISLKGALTSDSSPHSDGCFSSNYDGDMRLFQNYPNPFSTATTIPYELYQASHVQLSAYDIEGTKVVTLVSEQQPAGQHQVVWESGNYPGGVYYYKLNNGKYAFVRRMIIAK